MHCLVCGAVEILTLLLGEKIGIVILESILTLSDKTDNARALLPNNSTLRCMAWKPSLMHTGKPGKHGQDIHSVCLITVGNGRQSKCSSRRAG